MTDLTPLRDRLAVLCGWHHPSEPHDEAPNGFGEWWHDDHVPQTDHPIPPNDLASLAAAWPEWWNYRMEMFSGWWYGAAQRDDGNVETGWGPYTERCQTEYEARLRLTVAVREAMA